MSLGAWREESVLSRVQSSPVSMTIRDFTEFATRLYFSAPARARSTRRRIACCGWSPADTRMRGEVARSERLGAVELDEFRALSRALVREKLKVEALAGPEEHEHDAGIHRAYEGVLRGEDILESVRVRGVGLRSASSSHMSASTGPSATTTSGGEAISANGESARAAISLGPNLGIDANMARPISASFTMPKPTKPRPYAKPSGKGRKPNAAAAAGHDNPEASRFSFSPCLAHMSA